MINGCGAVHGRRIGRGDRSTRRKPAPLQNCSPQIPHDLTSDRTQGTAVGNRSLLVVHGLFNSWIQNDGQVDGEIELERM
jgi:hypothetical protein